jgi:hypothetical protein
MRMYPVSAFKWNKQEKCGVVSVCRRSPAGLATVTAGANPTYVTWKKMKMWSWCRAWMEMSDTLLSGHFVSMLAVAAVVGKVLLGVGGLIMLPLCGLGDPGVVAVVHSGGGLELAGEHRARRCRS